MKRSLVIAALIGVIGLLSACSTTSATHRLGSVKAVSDHQLQVCFDPRAVAPVAGQQVQLVRREQYGNPKFPPVFRGRPVGTAQINADASGRCVAATLVEGKARRFDEVHPALAIRQPH